MCGIVGAIRPGGGLTSELVRGMAVRMAYRGPDSAGEWVHDSSKVAFGHRRLSIVELSPLGHQPMTSSSGRYVITFNGEIFNFRQLARELHRPLRGGSDTEVMLECFEEYGIEGALTRFIGMFAFAVWDNREGRLTLARDRMGVKPLIFGWCGDTFVFTSDMRALAGMPNWSPEISKEAMALYLQYSYVPAPWTIYTSMQKLHPGHMVSLSLDTLQCGQRAVQEPYWQIPSGDPDADPEKAFKGVETVIRTLDQLLQEAVELRLVSDVPIGAFLSGGVDSSLVVALMQKLSRSPVKTFSIGFGDTRYNEAPYAKAVAEHLKTDHTELMVTEQMAREVVPILQGISDEPFGDASLIPTYLVAKLARSSVTVSLSGDGGDELFGGYDRYSLMHRLISVRNRYPGWVRSCLVQSANILPLQSFDLIQSGLRSLGVFPFQLNSPGEKLRRVVDLLAEPSDQELYYRAVRHWRTGEEMVAGIAAVPEVRRASVTRDPRRMMRDADSHLFLPDDILIKVDRASMAVSLEAREPLLDHRLVEFAFSLPTHVLYHDGRGKWPMRELLSRYVPRELIDRPKRGFGVPLDTWLRGELRPWAEELLVPKELEESGLRVAPIRAMWEEQLSGRRNRGQLLWDVLMFQDWRRQTV